MKTECFKSERFSKGKRARLWSFEQMLFMTGELDRAFIVQRWRSGAMRIAACNQDLRLIETKRREKAIFSWHCGNFESYSGDLADRTPWMYIFLHFNNLSLEFNVHFLWPSLKQSASAAPGFTRMPGGLRLIFLQPNVCGSTIIRFPAPLLKWFGEPDYLDHPALHRSWRQTIKQCKLLFGELASQSLKTIISHLIGSSVAHLLKYFRFGTLQSLIISDFATFCHAVCGPVSLDAASIDLLHSGWKLIAAALPRIKWNVLSSGYPPNL